MSFSDDDLKRLKERMKDADVPASHVKLLLARLDAAEVLADPSYECTCGFLGPKEYRECEGHFNWRKAAGKDA